MQSVTCQHLKNRNNTVTSTMEYVAAAAAACRLVIVVSPCVWANTNGLAHCQSYKKVFVISQAHGIYSTARFPQPTYARTHSTTNTTTTNNNNRYDDDVAFTLTFRSEISASIRHDATAEDIKDALEALEGVQSVVVEFADTTTVACASPANDAEVPQNSTWTVTFYTPTGDVPQVSFAGALALVDRLVGWLVGWFVGWFVGWLVGWLVG